MTARRHFDPGPLIEAAGGELRGLARRLEVDPALLCRPLTWSQADRYAVKLNKLPWEIWGDEWFAKEEN